MTYRSRYRDDDDYADSRADAFRCPGCEVNTGTGRYCDACRAEEDAAIAARLAARAHTTTEGR